MVVQQELAARFAVRHGALTAGNDLYRAEMTEEQAQASAETVERETVPLEAAGRVREE